MSHHARELGFGAVILFLDELILWLASHAADLSFVAREGQKLVKLVEASRADCPIPLVSFIAKQREIADPVRDQVTGAQLAAISDVLRFWEARFASIRLQDSNLPAIAEKRLLKPKSEADKAEIDTAFAQTMAVQKHILDMLLTDEGNPEMFRKLYPFSPALIETLVVMSFALQRERTALRVMLQILVDATASIPSSISSPCRSTVRKSRRIQRPGCPGITPRRWRLPTPADPGARLPLAYPQVTPHARPISRHFEDFRPSARLPKAHGGLGEHRDPGHRPGRR